MGVNYKVLKRGIDLVGSGALIIILFPVLLTISLLILVCDKQNPIFTQQRPGLHGQPFRIFKFRTMGPNRSLTIELSKVTKLGVFLRSCSLDELPQLINVLCGDMSLVGPRPLLMSYLPLYSEEQYARHHVKPGITGLAQVSGRNRLNWEEKFAYDLEYVRTLSFATDLKILLKTLLVICKPNEVNASATVTVEPFTHSRITDRC